MAARSGKMLCLVLLIACVSIFPDLSAGQTAPAPAPDCSGDIAELLPCLSFLTNSSVTTVAPLCCSALSNVSTASPFCLCQLISPANANVTAGLGVNDTRALELPGLCGLSISASSCSAVLGPSVAPAPFALTPAFSPAPLSLVPSSPVPAISPSTFAPVLAPGVPSTTPIASPVDSVAPAPVEDCSAETSSLVSCLDFLTGNATSPTKSCCKSLGNVVKTAPQCLCQLAASSGGSITGVNGTLVQELPSLCEVSVSLSICSGSAPSSPVIIEGPGGSPNDNSARPASPSGFFMVLVVSVVTLAHAVLQ